jgi:hypothetical protein
MTRALVSLGLLFAICFVAWAIYSPMHVHKQGACSLNSVEHQIAELALSLIVPPGPTFLSSRILVESRQELLLQVPVGTRRGRAPPSAFSKI